MPSIQIRDVPAATHAVLRRRAAMAGQSLQEYLRSRLVEDAATPTVDEVLERAGGRADLRDLPLHRVPHRRLLTRCWELRED